MSSRPWGYRSGGIQLVTMKVDSASEDIVAGDFVIAGTAGYVQQCAAGDKPIGVAWQTVAAGAADGDVSVQVNIAKDAIYEYPADAGTVSQSLVGTTMDVGGPQSIDIDASTDDVITVVGVNTTRNTLMVKLTPTFLGVV